MTPNVILRVMFSTPSARYFDYMERDQANKNTNRVELGNEKQNELEKSPDEMNMYFNYMDRSEATKLDDSIESENRNIKKADDKLLPAFNAEKNNITVKDFEELKKKIKISAKNKMNMWSVVGSFSNKFLEESGIINDGVLDQDKLKTRVRQFSKEFLTINRFDKSAYYQGNIHVNTDNVHFHIAISELENKKNKFKGEVKGKISQENLRKSKQALLKSVQSPEQRVRDIELLKEIDKERNKLLSDVRIKLNRKDYTAVFSSNGYEDTLIKDLYDSLPDDKRLWRYRSRSIEMRKPKVIIDKLIENYLKNDGNYDFRVFNALVQSQKYNDSYAFGEEIGKDISVFKENKLYETMGNAYLKALKKYDIEKSDYLNTGKRLEETKENLNSLNLIEEVDNYNSVDKDISLLNSQFYNDEIDTRAYNIQVTNLRKIKYEITKRINQVNARERIQKIAEESKRIENYLKENKNISDDQKVNLEKRSKILKEYSYYNDFLEKGKKSYIRGWQAVEALLKKDIYNLEQFKVKLPDSQLEFIRRDISVSRENIARMDKDSLSVVINKDLSQSEYLEIKKNIDDSYKDRLKFIELKQEYQSNISDMKKELLKNKRNPKKISKYFRIRGEQLYKAYKFDERFTHEDDILGEQTITFKIESKEPQRPIYCSSSPYNEMSQIGKEIAKIGRNLNGIVQEFARQSEETLIISNDNTLTISDKQYAYDLLREEEIKEEREVAREQIRSRSRSIY